MKKDFKQELTELINKHGLEKEMRVHRIERPEKKRKFRKKPRKEQGNETR